MKCYKCGNIIEQGASFCRYCGSKVQSEDTNTQTKNVSANETNANIFSTTDTLTQVSKTKKSITKKWWFWAILIIGVIIIASCITTGGETSAADIYVALSEKDEFDYSIPEKAVSFIESNPQFFPGNADNTGAMSDCVNYEADFPHVAKNPTKYADTLMEIYGEIIDCEEIETDYGMVTYLHIGDDSGDSYCMYYLGTLEDAFEGYSVSALILPFGITKFGNMNGTYTEAIIGAACYVEAFGDYEY